MNEPKEFRVVVGGIGTMYLGSDETEARQIFDRYVEHNEPTTLYVDDEIADEHEPTDDE